MSAVNGFQMNKLCDGLCLGYGYGGVGVVNGLPFGQLGRILASEDHEEKLVGLMYEGRGYVGGCASMYGRPLFDGIKYHNMLTCSSAATKRRLGVEESFSPVERIVCTSAALATAGVSARLARSITTPFGQLVQATRRPVSMGGLITAAAAVGLRMAFHRPGGRQAPKSN